jgi:hypothetical protein
LARRPADAFGRASESAAVRICVCCSHTSAVGGSAHAAAALPQPAPCGMRAGCVRSPHAKRADVPSFALRAGARELFLFPRAARRTVGLRARAAQAATPRSPRPDTPRALLRNALRIRCTCGPSMHMCVCTRTRETHTCRTVVVWHSSWPSERVKGRVVAPRASRKKGTSRPARSTQRRMRTSRPGMSNADLPASATSRALCDTWMLASCTTQGALAHTLH